MPALAHELVTTWARLARTADPGGEQHARRATEPLPFDWGAAHDAWTLAHTVATWARHVAEERGLTLPAAGDNPEAVAVAAARWLLAGRHVEWLRHRPEAAEAFDELRHAVGVARRAIDAPEPRWYAGQCGAETLATLVIAAVFGESPRCQTELYVRPDATTITCPTCGTVHDTQARREWLLASARDVLAHAELIGRAATALGKPITPAMVRGYARPERRLIAERGVDYAGRAVYRVGDVIEVFDRIAGDRGRRRIDRARWEALPAEVREEIGAARRAERRAARKTPAGGTEEVTSDVA